MELAETLTPGEKWELKEVDTAALEKASHEQVKNKETTPLTMLGFLYRSIFGKGYNGHFEKVHNQVFGIRSLSESNVRDLIAGIFATEKSE